MGGRKADAMEASISLLEDEANGRAVGRWSALATGTPCPNCNMPLVIMRFTGSRYRMELRICMACRHADRSAERIGRPAG